VRFYLFTGVKYIDDVGFEDVLCYLDMRLLYNYNSNLFNYKFYKYNEIYLDIDEEYEDYFPEIREDIFASENEELFKLKLTNAFLGTLLEGDEKRIFRTIKENMLPLTHEPQGRMEYILTKNLSQSIYKC